MGSGSLQRALELYRAAYSGKKLDGTVKKWGTLGSDAPFIGNWKKWFTESEIKIHSRRGKVGNAHIIENTDVAIHNPNGFFEIHFSIMQDLITALNRGVNGSGIFLEEKEAVELNPDGKPGHIVYKFDSPNEALAWKQFMDYFQEETKKEKHRAR